jgi:hypothetical protein
LYLLHIVCFQPMGRELREVGNSFSILFITVSPVQGQWLAHRLE